MANASQKVRSVFLDRNSALTLAEIKAALGDLKASEISMALCYLMRQRYLTREQVENTNSRGRKRVWMYTYHLERLPKEAA